MNLAVYLPLLAALAVGLIAPAVARRAQPAAAALTLAALGLVAAAGSTWALALLASTLVDDVRPGVDAPVPDAVGVLAAVTLLGAGVRVVLAAARRYRLFRAIRDAMPAGADVVVLADARLDAFAVPGRWHPIAARRRPGRIVVTDGMLRTLDDQQRRAMFAHERAHLSANHHRLRIAAELAAALNPCLIPAARSVAYLCERAADERAASDVGDRRVVASAVAAAALAGLRTIQPPHAALAFDELGVAERVVALGHPAPPRLRLIGAAAVLVAVAIVGTSADATGDCTAIIRSLLTL